MGWEILLQLYLKNTVCDKMEEMSKQKEAGITDTSIVEDLVLKHWTSTGLPADSEQKPSNFLQHEIQSGGKDETMVLCSLNLVGLEISCQC